MKKHHKHVIMILALLLIWSLTKIYAQSRQLENLAADYKRVSAQAPVVVEKEAEAAKVKAITSREEDKTPMIKWTMDEIKAMAQVVHAEARGESQFGKMLVARVIMNRVEGNPGMTVDQIIHRPNAFVQSDTYDSDDLSAVLEAAIEPRYRDIFTFFNPATATNRKFVDSKMIDVVLRVGNHVFCR